MTGEKAVPAKRSPTNLAASGKDWFEETCVNWPHNSPQGRGTGGCCWQWVDDGN